MIFQGLGAGKQKCPRTAEPEAQGERRSQDGERPGI